MHEIQTVACPRCEADVIRLLIDGRLKHLLPQRIFYDQLIAVQRGKIAVINGEVRVCWIGIDAKFVFISEVQLDF